MAAKGAVVKEEIMAKLLEIFPTAFSPDGKLIHVDMVENGSPVQIKIALTAVKVPILNTPESKVINEESFHIDDTEQEEIKVALEEMGVSF